MPTKTIEKYGKSSIFGGPCVEIMGNVWKVSDMPGFKLVFPVVLPMRGPLKEKKGRPPEAPFQGTTQSLRCDSAPFHTPWAKRSPCSAHASPLGWKMMEGEGRGGFVIHPFLLMVRQKMLAKTHKMNGSKRSQD